MAEPSDNPCSSEDDEYSDALEVAASAGASILAKFVLLTLIRWIAIYPVDRVIQPLNNRGQVTSF